MLAESCQTYCLPAPTHCLQVRVPAACLLLLLLLLLSYMLPHTRMQQSACLLLLAAYFRNCNCLPLARCSLPADVPTICYCCCCYCIFFCMEPACLLMLAACRCTFFQPAVAVAVPTFAAAWVPTFHPSTSATLMPAHCLPVC
jgi:hypothetical protein